MTAPATAKSKASIQRFLRAIDQGCAGGRDRKRGAAVEAAVVVTLTVTLAAELPKVAGLGLHCTSLPKALPCR